MNPISLSLSLSVSLLFPTLQLDCLLYAIFSWCYSRIESDPSEAKRLFAILLPVFERHILATYKSKFTQFVIFLVCGLDPLAQRQQQQQTNNSIGRRSGSIGDDFRDDDDNHSNNNEEEEASHDDPDENHEIQLYRDFATRLIKIVLDPSRAFVGRQAAVCYLASFVSRASFVCAETACETVSVLLRWAETYIKTWEKSSSLLADGRECSVHSLFYTVCQAAFYIMCFRGETAMRYFHRAERYHAAGTRNETNEQGHDGDDDDGQYHDVDDHGDNGNVEDGDFPDLEHVDIGAGRWEKLCDHPLEPLRYCLSSVREEFIDVAERHKLVNRTCLTTMKAIVGTCSRRPILNSKAKQKRRNIGRAIATPFSKPKRVRKQGGVGGIGQGSNPLDSFFPFDPFLLRHSHHFIAQHYRAWDDCIDEEDAADAAMDEFDETDPVPHINGVGSYDGEESEVDAEEDENDADDNDSDVEHETVDENDVDDEDGTMASSVDQEDGSMYGVSVASSAVAMSIVSMTTTQPSTDGTISPTPSTVQMTGRAEQWLTMRRDRAFSIGDGSW